MRITSKGQVTIPIEIREKLGLVPESEVDFKLEGNTARLVKIPATKRARSRGAAVVERLRGKGDIKMSTDEILALTRRAK
jgi:AbrB family looped-hinge helix DNA binding protein